MLPYCAVIFFNNNNNKIKNKIFLFIYFLCVQRLCRQVPVVARVPRVADPSGIMLYHTHKECIVHALHSSHDFLLVQSILTMLMLFIMF